MKKTRITGAALALLIAVTGCSSMEPTEAETETPKAEEATPEETDTPEVDDLAACEILLEEITIIPELFIDFPETLDDEAAQPYLSVNDNLSRAMLVASPGLKSSVEDLRAPFKEIADVVEGGGGGLTLDTSGLTEDVTAVMAACVDAGYRVDDSAEADVEAEEVAEDIPEEGESALASARNYLEFMPFSKQGLIDQLSSDYGDQYPEEAAKYAAENVGADWNEQALKSARNYMESSPMSKAALHDQLTSEYGDQFTKAQADYAISHLDD